MQAITDDVWTLTDDDFRAFIERVSDAGHIWTDRPGIDPAMQALVTERHLRRAARKLASLDTLFATNRLAIAAQQCRFIADRLAAGEGVETFEATAYLEAARTIIRNSLREIVDD